MPRRAEPVRSVEERNRLVEENLRLAGWCVGEFLERVPRLASMADDLRQEAYIALMRAADLWNPAQGKFTTYATWAIRHRLARAARNLGSMIHIPEHVTGEERRELVRRLRPAELNDDTASRLIVHDHQAEERDDRLDFVEQALRRLPPRLQQVTRLRLEGRTHRDIANSWNLSYQRIQQMGKRAITLLREMAQAC